MRCMNIRVTIIAVTWVSSSNSTQNLDPAIQKQLDQYLKQQKLSLSKQEKQALYEAILAEQSPYSYGQGSDSSSARIAAGLMNFMNDLKISYDGSVHYRDKMASLNLVAKKTVRHLMHI